MYPAKNQHNNIITLDAIYQKLDFDRNLVFKFFTIFSLFEYALKNAGYVDEDNKNIVKPDWDSFANDIHGKYQKEQSPELNKAIDYFMANPPMKQVLSGNNLIFRPGNLPNNYHDTQRLSIFIRRVRNNLFHGGKVPYDHVRDTELISNSLIILDAWARCNSDVASSLRNLWNSFS